MEASAYMTSNFTLKNNKIVLKNGRRILGCFTRF